MTKRQLERAIVRLAAIIEDSQAAFEASYRVGLLSKRHNRELCVKRSALLSENATLRAEIDMLWETVHGLVDGRHELRSSARALGQKVYDLLEEQHATR